MLLLLDQRIVFRVVVTRTTCSISCCGYFSIVVLEREVRSVLAGVGFVDVDHGVLRCCEQVPAVGELDLFHSAKGKVSDGLERVHENVEEPKLV